MKRILIKSFAVAAMALVCGNAWAEHNGTSAVYCPELDANYDDLNKALTGANAATANNFTFKVYNDVKLSDRFTNTTKNITILPQKNIKITRSSKICFLASDKGNLNIGSDDYVTTIDGNNINAFAYQVFRTERGGAITLTNVKIQNFNFSSVGSVFQNKESTVTNDGKLFIKNVTVNNCTTSNSAFFINGKAADDMIYLQESLKFINCNGTHISTVQRIRLGEKDGTTNITSFATQDDKPITVLWTGSNVKINSTNGVVKVGSAIKNNFTLINPTLSFKHNGNADLKITQTYDLSVTDAKAATLILPFESTIPEGVKAYKLTYESSNTLNAEAVTGNLPANIPVLINAEQGTYNFVTTADNNTDAVFGSESKSEGVLIGVYTETQVPAGNYILAKGDQGVGFYKTKANTSKVAPYHAYLTINTSDSAKPSFFRVIGGGDGETTLIKGVETNEEKAQEGVYNLNGVRMQETSKKGLYIKNGKKMIIK